MSLTFVTLRTQAFYSGVRFSDESGAVTIVRDSWIPIASGDTRRACDWVTDSGKLALARAILTDFTSGDISPDDPSFDSLCRSFAIDFVSRFDLTGWAVSGPEIYGWLNNYICKEIESGDH